jgi:hypothetical protein
MMPMGIPMGIPIEKADDSDQIFFSNTCRLL